MALQEVLNSSIWVIKDDKSNYQPLYGQFLYTLNTDASGDDDKGMLYVGNGTEWINVMGTALSSVVENILATVPFEQIDNKTIFDAINEKANKATTLEGYGIEDAYTKTTIDAIILALEAELAGKQDKLTAGDNISIDGNKISVTGLTKDSVGLGNVDNTSDADKPVSNAVQTALDLKADKSQVANISTEGSTTKIQGNLEVTEVDTGEGGSIMTGTMVAHGQVDVDSISVGMSSPLDSVSTAISSTSKDTEIPTAKSVYSSVSLRALNDASNLTANNVNAWKGKLGISDIETEIANKADKATTLGGYGITDAKIADGTITLGENSIIPLTASSDISGDKVKGIVAEATKATQDGDGNVISETYATTTVVEGKQNKLSAGANITIDETTNTISATDTTYTAGTGITIENNVISATGGGGSGTVKSVNNVEPGDDGNVSLTTANIPNLGISEDGTTITIGDKSIEPLTVDSTISANKIEGVVAEATKATQDGNGNVISTTYAKATELDSKQNKLTAGNNITIDDATNTISAKDTTYTAGTNITISASNEISATDTKYTAGTNISISDENAISVTGLTKASVGLGNVDNTSDANKPISDATQTALNDKQNINDNTLETEAKTIVGAINENFDEIKTNTASISVLSNALYSHTDNFENPHKVSKDQVGLDKVDNTSDAEKPVSTATQAALDLKADKTQIANISTNETITTISGSLSVGEIDTGETGSITTGTLITHGQIDADSISVGSSSAFDAVSTAISSTSKDTEIPTAKATYTAVNTAVTNLESEINGKQDKLSAGDNITIDESTNTISAKDTKYTAGTGINISDDNVITATGGVKGTVTSVNNQIPDDGGNVSLGVANIPGAYSSEQATTDLALKQDKLSAGANITISETNEISATDTKYTAGANVTINASNVISATDTKYTAGTNITISEDNAISVTGLTKTSVGLGNVDNTSDADKPISTATQTALDAKQDVANLVTAFGTTPSDKKYPSEKLVNDALNQTNQRVTGVENDTQTLSTSKQDKLTAGTNITITGSTISSKDTTYTAGTNISISDANAISVTGVYTYEEVDEKLATKADTSSLDDKQNKLTAGTNITIDETTNTINATDTKYTAGTNIAISDGNVISVTGLTKASVGLGNVDNTSDANKPISTATQSALDEKQNKLTAGANITISATNEISATNTTYTAGSNISISNENAISVTGVYTSSQVDTLLSNKADTSSLVGKQDKLTAGSNITISDNNEISVMGLTKVSVGLDNVDNTSDANKPISTATQTALDAKQDVSNLVTAFSETPVDTKYPSEKLVYDSIENVQNTVDGELATKANEDATNITGENVAKWKEALEIDVLEADLGAKQNIAIDIAGIAAKTVENALLELNTGLSGKQATIKAGDNISIGSDGVTINVSGVVPEATKATQDGDGRNIVETYATIASLQTKQDVSNLVTTIDSTSDDTHYPSAKAVYDYAQAGVTSTVETTITPTTAQTATEIANALAKKARVVVIPSLANAGAIYIKESDTYSSVNPIYPDPTNNVYEFTNMQNVKVFVDSVGDSVDLVIEYRG